MILDKVYVEFCSRFSLRRERASAFFSVSPAAGEAPRHTREETSGTQGISYLKNAEITREETSGTQGISYL